MPPKSAPQTHAGVETIACTHKKGASADAGLADLECADCMRTLSSEKTTISQIFAVMRQWDSVTQVSLAALHRVMFSKGCLLIYPWHKAHAWLRRVR
jgi:hypothetical protein